MDWFPSGRVLLAAPFSHDGYRFSFSARFARNRSRLIASTSRLANEPRRKKPTALAISEGASVRSADQERKVLPVTSDKKGAVSIARRTGDSSLRDVVGRRCPVQSDSCRIALAAAARRFVSTADSCTAK
jgi:hypothetical protein